MLKNKRISLGLVFFGLVIIDQVIKAIFVIFYSHYLNTAGVWGINLLNGLIYYLSLIAFVVLGIYLLRKKLMSFISKLGIIIIASGAISNLIDRLARGGVIDIFDTGFWPIFNLSDVMIFVGVLLFSLSYIRSKD